MNRDIYPELVAWKQFAKRKPLILKGSRQVGKTYILQLFGEQEYGDVAYVNFQHDPAVSGLFAGKLDPDRIVEDLSIYRGKKIDSQRTLIFLDEIQESDRAVTSLKYFSESALYHVVSAGSLLGLKVGGAGSFPVGKVHFLNLFPLSFKEFLSALGKQNLREYLENIATIQPLRDAFHEECQRYLRLYFYIGGMPDAIMEYIQTKDYQRVRTVHENLLTTYTFDFKKYSNPTEANRILQLWDSVPAQLTKENKKFQYAKVQKHARARDYHASTQWLIDAGLLYPAYHIQKPERPLLGFSDMDIFKLFLLDVGLLGARLGLSAKVILGGDSLYMQYQGAFAENYVAQVLATYMGLPLYYWTLGHKAEIDFVIAHEKGIFPLEVKAGRQTRSASLDVYYEKYRPSAMFRVTALNLKQEKNMCNFPLYLASEIYRMIQMTVNGMT